MSSDCATWPIILFPSIPTESASTPRLLSSPIAPSASTARCMDSNRDSKAPATASPRSSFCMALDACFPACRLDLRCLVDTGAAAWTPVLPVVVTWGFVFASAALPSRSCSEGRRVRYVPIGGAQSCSRSPVVLPASCNRTSPST